MPLRMMFTAIEREKIGVLVNNLSIFAAQLLIQDRSGLATQATSNLAKVKREHEDLLKRLDELARESRDESPLRLIEDLARMPADVAQALMVVRRCLLASAFLGHCIAHPTHPQIASDAVAPEKRLH